MEKMTLLINFLDKDGSGEIDYRVREKIIDLVCVDACYCLIMAYPNFISTLSLF